MIIAKCPLRISLAGGSTDLQDFIDQNDYGAVISFPSTVYSYISIHKNNRKKYIINYTNREEIEDLNHIKNDIAREVLKYFCCEPVTMTFNTDIQTSGSGLASSSAYMIAAVAAVSRLKKINLSNFEICNISLKLERNFNPLTGFQDPYGCGIGSFKKIIFQKNKDPQITYLKQDFFNNFNMFLKYTGVSRSSTQILQEVVKVDRKNFLKNVDELEISIKTKNQENFLKLINKGWEEKKILSPHIINNENIKKIDFELKNNHNVLSHRLCGAGNGGYFFILTRKNYLIEDAISVNINQDGVEVFDI
jgi:D-glycero-alpha-D-manno-heptose-7-phosphate kinase